MVEGRADVSQNVGAILDEALVGGLPRPPVTGRICRRDRPLTIGYRIRRIRNILAIRVPLPASRFPKRQRTIALQIEIGRLRPTRRPLRVGSPAIRSGLEGRHPPGWLRAAAVEIIPEERRLDVLAKLARRFPTEREEADAVTLRCLPFAMKPRAHHHEIGALRVVLGGVTEDLPRSPRIFLIVESGDVEIGNRRRVQLIHPRFFLPE